MSEDVEPYPEFVLPGGGGRIVATTGVCVRDANLPRLPSIVARIEAGEFIVEIR